MFDVVPTRRKGELHASKRAKITNIFLPLMVPEVIFLDCTIQMPENCQNQLIVQLWKTSQQIPTPTPIMKVVELHIVPRVSHNSLRASRNYVTITSKTGTRFDWSTMTSLSRFITTRDEINTVKKTWIFRIPAFHGTQLLHARYIFSLFFHRRLFHE